MLINTQGGGVKLPHLFMHKPIDFTNEEMIAVFEVACIGLKDAGMFDMAADSMCVSDEYMTELRDKLNAVMDSDVDLFEKPSLRARQSDVWASHSTHPKEDWIHEVYEGATHLGYWEWVESKLEQNNN